MEYLEFLKLKESNSHGDFLLPLSYYCCLLPEDFSILPMHWHEEMEMTYIAKGSCQYEIELESYLLEEGDLLFIQPCHLHTIKYHGSIPAATQSFVFHLGMLHGFQTDASSIQYFMPLTRNEVSMNRIIKSSAPQYTALKDAFFQLTALYEHKPFGYELEMKSLFFHIFFLLFSNGYIHKKKELSLKQSTTEKIKTVLTYIQSNYAKPLAIAELAAVCDFSEYHFMRFFKKHVGITCIEYINNYRLDVASKLLEKSDIPVLNIAFDVGFTNISYFNKLFKQKFRVTPSVYRKEVLLLS